MVLFTSVCAIIVPVPFEYPEVEPEGSEAVQSNTVPPIDPIRLIAVVPPVQNACVVGIAVTVGNGLMVITTFSGVPVHPFANGVIVYVTVAGDKVLLVSVWEIVVPLPDENPEAVPVVRVAVHENVVPVVALESPIAVAVPEQIVCKAGVASAIGAGSTVTLVEPAHPIELV